MNTSKNFFETVSTQEILLAAAIIAVTVLLLKWLRGWFEALERNRPNMRFFIRQMEPALRILVWFLSLTTCASLLLTQNAFVAAIGSAAIAIGLGAQDLIKNLIGGLVIVADRPYQLGDRLKIGQAYGEVQQIGLRSTKIMTPDDTLITVPNSEALGAYAFNANAGVPECMVTTEIFLPTNADPNRVLKIGREVAVSSPYTHLGRRIAVKLDDQFTEAPFMSMKIRAYVYDHRYEPLMQTDITRRCKKILLQEGLLDRWLQGEE